MTAIAPPSPTPAYCTVIANRRPTQKMHTTLGHAKNAVSARSYWTGWGGKPAVEGGQVYEWRDGGWHLLFDIAHGTPTNELPWRKERAEAEAEAAAARHRREESAALEELADVIDDVMVTHHNEPSRNALVNAVWGAGYRKVAA